MFADEFLAGVAGQVRVRVVDHRKPTVIVFDVNAVIDRLDDRFVLGQLSFSLLARRDLAGHGHPGRDVAALVRDRNRPNEPHSIVELEFDRPLRSLERRPESRLEHVGGFVGHDVSEISALDVGRIGGEVRESLAGGQRVLEVVIEQRDDPVRVGLRERAVASLRFREIAFALRAVSHVLNDAVEVHLPVLLSSDRGHGDPDRLAVECLLFQFDVSNDPVPGELLTEFPSLGRLRIQIADGVRS